MYPLKEKQSRYGELDALRGIAALLVVFFHFTMGRPAYNSFFKIGITGVDLFFIISGFVIFMSLQKVSKGIDFVINRTGRLYPTYWAGVSFTFLIMFFKTLYDEGENLKTLVIKFIANLTMFQFYLRIPDLDGPYWTLIIEMLFYIAIFILFKLNWLKYLTAIGFILCSAIVVLVHYYYDLQSVKYLIKAIPLFQFMPLFFAGISFYKIYTKKEKNLPNYLIILFCMLCQISLFPIAGRLSIFITWKAYILMLTIYFSLFTLFVNNGLTFIVNKTTLFLGKISYALYLIHQYVSLSIIIPFFYTKLGINFWVVVVFIDLPIILGVATFITYKIEVPYSKKLKFFLTRLYDQIALKDTKATSSSGQV